MRTAEQAQSQPLRQASSSLNQSTPVTSGPTNHAQLILQFQRSIGNRAVQRMLHARASERINRSSNTLAIWRHFAPTPQQPQPAAQQATAQTEPGISFPYRVNVSKEMDSNQLLLEFVKQYHGVKTDAEAEQIRDKLKYSWRSTPPVVNAKHVTDGFILITVTDPSLRSSTQAEKQQRKEYFEGLSPREQTAINEETDKQFSEKTQYPRGQKLGTSPDDQQAREYWRSRRDELIGQRETIDQLPPEIKQLILGERATSSLNPKDFETVLRIADKLKNLTRAEIAEYKSRTTAKTTDLSEFEASLDHFLAERKEREATAKERRELQTKLFGLEDLYRRYRTYISTQARSINLMGGRTPMGVGTGVGTLVSSGDTRSALEADLIKAGFPGGISDFEKFIHSYEQVFERETLALATVMLDQYEHNLLDQSSAQAQQFPPQELAQRKKDIAATRQNLKDNPTLIYGLDRLLQVSIQSQSIQSGSIYEMIIRDHIQSVHLKEAIPQLILGVIAIAAGIFSAGSGTVAVLGAGTALGIGAYQAVDEFRRYEMQSAAHGAQLTSEDPTMAWVIVAVIGAGLDAAAFASVLPKLRPALTAFNTGAEAGDIAALNQKLAQIAKDPKATAIEKEIIDAVLRAAKAEAEARTAWKSIVRPSTILRSVIIPGAEEFGRFVYAVYLSFKRGIRDFQVFVKTNEAVALIGDSAKLTPEALAELKTGYLKAIEELESIAAHGKALNMTDKDISGFMKLRGDTKAMSVEQVMAKMTDWQSMTAARNLKWGNPLSKPTFGHVFIDHGMKVKPQQLIDRARGKGHQIGQWLDDKVAAEFIADVAKQGEGVHEVPLSTGMGRSFLDDGTELTTDMARVVVKKDGTVRTAFPYNSAYKNER